MRYVLQPETVLRIRSIQRVILMILAVLCATAISPWGSILAGDDQDREEMQEKLNSEVMEKPFSVEDAAKIDAYVEDAMKRNLKPRAKPPAIWKSGYTCADLHNYTEYRDCLYYHRYYGYYWR